LGVPRSAVREGDRGQRNRPAHVDEVLAARLERLIETHSTYGSWFVTQHVRTPRPRVQGRCSRAERSNERWAMDVTHIDCAPDGWAHLAAVIDCHDRELVGYELSLRARAKEAERALENACLARFGTLRPSGKTPIVRSDNGLIFQSRRFRAACRDYRLRPGVHHPVYPAAEQDRGALLP